MSIISQISPKEPDKQILTTDKSGKDYNLCIVSDTSIWKSAQWMFNKIDLKIYEYSADLFTNRNISDFIDADKVSLIWININKQGATKWLQLNHNQLKESFNIISVYTTFSKWALEIEATTVMSIKMFESIEHIDSENMVKTLVNMYKKISSPTTCQNLLSCLRKKKAKI